MPPRPTRSLKYEYELYVEEEIENYKESIPRSILLGIGDEAVSAMAREPQFMLTELLLAEEVDRIIFRRLRLPAYQTWRRRRLKLLAEFRRPEHWGLRPDDLVVRAAPPAQSHVLVAGTSVEASALYLAAHGCDVTALANEPDDLDRVMQAAVAAGLAQRVHTYLADLSSWTPETPLSAVIVTPEAMQGLSAMQRARVIETLKTATADGGVHLVQAIAASRAALSLDELRSRYRDWTVSVEDVPGASNAFLARKELS